MITAQRTMSRPMRIRRRAGRGGGGAEVDGSMGVVAVDVVVVDGFAVDIAAVDVVAVREPSVCDVKSRQLSKPANRASAFSVAGVGELS